jgi:hypothetical protein
VTADRFDRREPKANLGDENNNSRRKVAKSAKHNKIELFQGKLAGQKLIYACCIVTAVSRRDMQRAWRLVSQSDLTKNPLHLSKTRPDSCEQTVRCETEIELPSRIFANKLP